MNTSIKIGLCVLLVGLLGVTGCKKEPGGKTTVDISTPIAEVKTMAEKMDVEKLRSMAMQYKESIEAKSAEIDKITAKIKEIPVVEQMGEEAKGLQTEVKQLGNTLKALKDRFQVYYDMLKEKGGDLSGLEL